MTTYAGIDSFPADFPIPDDSAPPTASNLLVSIEPIADRTIWLKNRTGQRRLFASYRLIVADEPSSGTSALAYPTTVVINSTNVDFTASRSMNAATWPLLSTGDPIKANDVVEFSLTAIASLKAVAGGAYINPWPEIILIAKENASATTVITGAKQTFSAPTFDGDPATFVRVTIQGRYIVAADITTSFKISIDGAGNALADDGSHNKWMKLIGSLDFECHVWRSNS